MIWTYYILLIHVKVKGSMCVYTFWFSHKQCCVSLCVDMLSFLLAIYRGEAAESYANSSCLWRNARPGHSEVTSPPPISSTLGRLQLLPMAVVILLFNCHHPKVAQPTGVWLQFPDGQGCSVSFPVTLGDLRICLLWKNPFKVFAHFYIQLFVFFVMEV